MTWWVTLTTYLTIYAHIVAGLAECQWRLTT